MRIVYRMRGLLGDATEEFVERFDEFSRGSIGRQLGEAFDVRKQDAEYKSRKKNKKNE